MLDNEEYGGRSGIAIGIDTLVQETNRGSRQWIAGSSELPPSMRALDEVGRRHDRRAGRLPQSAQQRPGGRRCHRQAGALIWLKARSAPLGVALALADAAGAASGVPL